EQALLVIRQLHLPMAAVEEQFRRMVFNIVARNQDDHVKNIAFLMNKQGEWALAPAFDVSYSFNPSGRWTATHQMTLNNKRDGFTLEDFDVCAKSALMKRGRAATIIEEVQAAVARWPDYATDAGIADELRDQMGDAFRMSFRAQ
ncbi:MAG: HipA domain-containing protein, partial [Gemmatimonas sp.]